MPPPAKRLCTAPPGAAPQVAARLAAEGATLVVEGVPAGTEFGVDLHTWSTGERWVGVSLIPPGLHFVSHRAATRGAPAPSPAPAPRTGWFHVFGRGEVVVRRGDPVAEDVVEVGEEEVARVRGSLGEVEGSLGPYPYHTWSKWISLSHRITEATLARLEPASGRIASVADMVAAPNHHLATTTSSTTPALPPMVARPGTAIRFTPLEARRFPEGSSASAITQHSLDSSYQLYRLVAALQRLYGDTVSGGSMGRAIAEREVLAELQFAFLAFLAGHNYDSFEQWRRLVSLLCSCDEALEAHPALFTDLLADLYFQMKEVPSDFFVDIVSSSNFLCSSLRTLFRNISDSAAVCPRLKEKARKFGANVTKRFGWDFAVEAGEEEPTVVEEDAPAPAPPLSAELEEPGPGRADT